MGIYNFGGGVRVPAASGAVYLRTPDAQLMLTSVGLGIFNNDGPIDLSLVCPLPVPEKVNLAQLVMVGRVTQGQITASIVGVPWNLPFQLSTYASVGLSPATPLETQDQQKAVMNVAPGVLKVDRVNCYSLQARFVSDVAVNHTEAMSLFYFELYWN